MLVLSLRMLEFTQVKSFVRRQRGRIRVVVEETRAGHMLEVVVIQNSKTHGWYEVLGCENGL